MSGLNGFPNAASGTYGTVPPNSFQSAPQPVVQIINPRPEPPTSSIFGRAIVGAFSFVVSIILSFFFALTFFCVGIALLSVMIVGIAGQLENIDFDLENVGAAAKSGVSTKFVKGSKTAEKKIAILRIEGIITGEEDGFVMKQIAAVIEDTSICGVVLRIDSPGGTVSGSDYYLYKLKEMKNSRKIPVIVSMGSVAASGGYYVAMASDEIFAEHSTITGSIGVIASLFNVAELAQRIGFESTPIASGNLKGMGSITKPMTDEEKKIWEDLIENSFSRFKEIIRAGRVNFAENPEALDIIADGRVYTAKQAVANGLIDQIGYLDNAIDSCIAAAGLTLERCQVIRFKKKSDFLTALTEAHANVSPLESISDLTTPRLHYICPQVVPHK